MSDWKEILDEDYDHDMIKRQVASVRLNLIEEDGCCSALVLILGVQIENHGRRMFWEFKRPSTFFPEGIICWPSLTFDKFGSQTNNWTSPSTAKRKSQ